jgi:uncharacterized protein with HEPN domain
MNERREYRDFLVDILNAVNDIENFVKDIDIETFVNSRE